jgi:integrase
VKAKISKRTVDALKPCGADTLLWDSEIHGFGVRCRTSGSKHYVLKFRTSGSRQRWATIGRHGSPWTPEMARKRAKELLGEVAAGRDPAEAKQREKDNLTVAQLCEQYLAVAPFRVLPKKKRPKKASTLITDRSNIERHVKPLLGPKRVRSLTQKDIERFQRDVATGKTAADLRTKPRGRAIIRGGEGTAARATTVLGALLSYAVDEGMRPDNPFRGVALYQGEKRKRYLSGAELTRLGDALALAEKKGDNPFAVAAVRLLVLTGARKSEILSLRWEHVDVERSHLRLPDSKTGAKDVPLGAAALQVLADLPRVDGNPYVIAGENGKHLVGLQKAWVRLRNRANLKDVRLHDLRHSFASVAVASGDSLYLVGKVLGHQQARTTERYAHLNDDPVRAVADRAAGQIAAAMNSGNGNSAEVVPLPGRGQK